MIGGFFKMVKFLSGLVFLGIFGIGFVFGPQISRYGGIDNTETDWTRSCSAPSCI